VPQTITLISNSFLGGGLISYFGVEDASFASRISSQHYNTPYGAEILGTNKVLSSIGFLLGYLICHYLLKNLSSKSIFVIPMRSGKSYPSSSQTSIVNVAAPGSVVVKSYEVKKPGLHVLGLNDALSVITVFPNFITRYGSLVLLSFGVKLLPFNT
jgi:hypothetical protein